MSFSVTNKNDPQQTLPRSSKLSKRITEKEISHQIPVRSQSKSTKYSKSSIRSTKPIKRRRKSRRKSCGRVLIAFVNGFGVYGFQYIASLFGFALFIGLALLFIREVAHMTCVVNKKLCMKQVKYCSQKHFTKDRKYSIEKFSTQTVFSETFAMQKHRKYHMETLHTNILSSNATVYFLEDFQTVPMIVSDLILHDNELYEVKKILMESQSIELKNIGSNHEIELLLSQTTVNDFRVLNKERLCVSTRNYSIKPLTNVMKKITENEDEIDTICNCLKLIIHHFNHNHQKSADTIFDCLWDIFAQQRLNRVKIECERDSNYQEMIFNWMLSNNISGNAIILYF